MLRKSRWMMCLAVLAMSSALYAQDGERPGRGEGGGRGGRGFMGGGGGRGGQLSLLDLASAESVQTELGLSEDQKKSIRTLSSGVREKVRGMAGGNPDASIEERRANMMRIVEETRKASAEAAPKIAETLDEAQYKRLKQIHWQAAGITALQDPEVTGQLELTPDQQTQLDTVFSDYDAQVALQPREGGAGDFREIMAKRRQLAETRDTNAKTVLNAAQQAKFESLKGDAFDVSSLRGGFGGGRGGRGGEGGPRPEGGDRRQRPEGDRPERPST